MIEVVRFVEKLIESHNLVTNFVHPLDTIKEELFNVALDDEDAHIVDLLTSKFKSNFSKLRDILAKANEQAT